MCTVTPHVLESIYDTAVLGSLDDQRCWDEAAAFAAWSDRTTPVPLAGLEQPVRQPFPVYLFTHTRTWIAGTAEVMDVEAPVLWASFPQGIEGGTSGSPIVDSAGAIVALVSWSADAGPHPTEHGPEGAAPRPQLTLPAWVLRTIQRNET